MGRENDVMDPRKKLSKSEFTGVLAATVIIFLIGLFLGGYFSDVKLSAVTGIQDDLRIDTMALELQYLIANENICAARTGVLEEELSDVGAKLDYMENQLGIDNKNVIRLKEYYSLLQIRHWLLNKRQVSECKLNKNIILYFYSNDIKECPTCKEQGFVLDYLNKKYNDLAIYAFDINSFNAAVKTLIEQNQIEESPSIVVNEKTYSGFRNSEEVEKLFI